MGNTLTGNTDDDSGATQPNSATAAGATPNAEVTQIANTTPGRRLKNPLGQLSSYTYQLSLYMITPDAYDAFVTTGRKNINIFSQAVSTAGTAQANTKLSGGAFLIAQSGGSGAKSARAPGFDFDYGIDNLSFRHLVSPKAEGSSAFNTEIKFTITEPYGFSFVTNLKTANQAILDYAGGKSFIPGNPTKQFYILGIRFYGYDASGRLMTGKEKFEGQTLDPNASGSGALFETFYDIYITSVKFKIDGKATVYDISAVAVAPNAGFGVKKGYIRELTSCYGATVKDVLTGPDGLLTRLNYKQQEMVTNHTIKIPTKYSIEWAPGAEVIADSLLYKKEQDPNKSKTSSSSANTTAGSNDKEAVKAQPNLSKADIQFAAGPLLACLDQAITSSTYLDAGLKIQYPSTSEPTNDKIKDKQLGKIAWYNVSARLSTPQWDDIINDWAYDITYIIQPYDTPLLDSPYVFSSGGTKTAYMPHKRYEYWYSGKNSEIIDYTQTLDNSFFNVVLADSPQQQTTNGGDQAVNTTTRQTTGSATNAASNKSGASIVPGQSTDQVKTNTLTLGGEAKGGYLTSLFDPGSYAHAKLTILGDPDFLVQDSGSVNELYNKHYGTDGFTINPTGGQVFFEIDFKEAIDYESQTGTLNINDKILFWDYPENVANMVHGLSYTLVSVQSSFSNGSFKQTLDAYINPFGGPSAVQEGGRENPEASASPAAGATTGLKPNTPSTAGSSNTGK
jgi:hypothetical protein